MHVSRFVIIVKMKNRNQRARWTVGIDNLTRWVIQALRAPSS